MNVSTPGNLYAGIITTKLYKLYLVTLSLSLPPSEVIVFSNLPCWHILALAHFFHNAKRQLMS